MQLQRQHEMDEAAANDAIQRSMVENMQRRQQVLTPAPRCVMPTWMMCDVQCRLLNTLQEELQQLHDMQRGRDRAIASGRYDVAVAAQVP
jgi:hypothetical protein